MDIICDYSKCTGCAECHDICPKSAISIIQDENGFLFPKINKEKCINCNLCRHSCPVLHTERIRKNALRELEIREGWSLDDEIRSKSSSGGIFGQIASDLLIKRWKVVGVYFDGKRAYHKMISSKKELEALQNTKYVQSNACNIYAKIYNELKGNQNILFSGTPCQIAGLYSFLFKKKYDGKLLTIEVICHGVPSYLILDKSLEYNNAIAVKSFRNKSEGWGYQSQQMEYLCNDGTTCTKSRDVDLFYHYFFGKKNLRTSCYQCPFAKIPRTADITIGDSWGTSNPSKEQVKKGLSLILINNKKALDFITKEPNIYLRKIGWFTEIEINRNIYTPFPPLSYVRDSIYVNNIRKKIELNNPKEVLENEPLGYIEKKEKGNIVKSILNIILSKFLSQIIGKGELEKYSRLRFEILIIMLKLKDYTNLNPSEHYLSNNFLSLTKALYKSKKQ